MAYIINLKTFQDSRGDLSVLDSELPFAIQRVYYIYNTTNLKRGGHRHKITKQILICLSGSCSVFVNNGRNQNTYLLNSPEQCLYLNPEDWHYMNNFQPNTILLVLASEKFDINDYINEQY
jgi:hypothetical protein